MRFQQEADLQCAGAIMLCKQHERPHPTGTALREILNGGLLRLCVFVVTKSQVKIEL